MYICSFAFRNFTKSKRTNYLISTHKMLTDKNKIYGIFLLTASILAALLLIRLNAPTCYDSNEKGKDCGGECPPCADTRKCPQFAEIEIEGERKCNEPLIFISDLPSRCKPTWDFGKDDKEDGLKVNKEFVKGKYIVKLYLHGIQVGEKKFEIECAAYSTSKPSIEKLKPVTPSYSSPSLSPNCDKPPNIVILGKYKCNEEITCTCELPDDCNAEWIFEDGNKKSGCEVKYTLPDSDEDEYEYEVKLRVGSYYTYPKKITISCVVPIPTPPVNNCVNIEMKINNPEKVECKKETLFTCNLPPECNPRWVFEGRYERRGTEIKYAFNSGGQNTVELYSNDKFLKKDINVNCTPTPPLVVATCNDGKQNGDETGIDCGGSKCPTCPPPKPYQRDEDIENDLQIIIRDIKRKPFRNRTPHYNNIMEKHTMCNKEKTQVIYGDKKECTIKDYIMDILDRNVSIKEVNVHKDENTDCIVYIIIEYN